MSNEENKILKRMELFFNNKEKALDWYKEPHSYFRGFFKQKVSPKEMLDMGKGEEVLKWIELTIGL